MSVQNLGRVTGMSAYEIAVEQGFIGDEDAWLASLQGDEGPAGEDGAAAGFGTPTISVSTLSAGSAATASVSATGTDTAKVFHFDFGIPQGEPGSTASLVAGTGIDITGDTITNTMPYDDAATASYIFNNFGMSVSTTSTLETATAPISEGSATVSLFWNRWVKPALSVYIDNTLIDTIEAEDWVYDSQTDYNTASLTGGGSISHDQHNSQFLISGVSGDEVKLEYIGTSVTRTPLDDLYIDNTIARTSQIPTYSAGDNIDIDRNTISVQGLEFTSTHEEGDPYTVYRMDADEMSATGYEYNSEDEYDLDNSTVIGAGTVELINNPDDTSLMLTPEGLEYYDNQNNIQHTLTFSDRELLFDNGAVALAGDIPTPDGTTITSSNGVWSAVGGGGSTYTASTGIDITNDVITNTMPFPVVKVNSSLNDPASWSADQKTEVGSYIASGKYCVIIDSNSHAAYYEGRSASGGRYIGLFFAPYGSSGAGYLFSYRLAIGNQRVGDLYNTRGNLFMPDASSATQGQVLLLNNYHNPYWADISQMPACPTTTDGAYVLKATVSDGAVTYEWVAQS